MSWNVAGAICRQASQSMQVESTKKSPGAFSGSLFDKSAIAKAEHINDDPGGAVGSSAGQPESHRASTVEEKYCSRAASIWLRPEPERGGSGFRARSA